MRLYGLTPLLLLAGCASTPEQAERTALAAQDTERDLATELAGLVPGTPSSCLPTAGRTQLSSKGFGSTIVYRVSRDLAYRTDTSGGCGSTGRDDILVSQRPTTRICRGDIIQTIDRASRFPTGSCSLGDFTPYTRP